MIKLEVDSTFVEDLKDDFLINEDKTLYDFLEGDPVKAFYLGYNIYKWFESLDKKQKYLYSKQARHNRDDLQKYESQIEYWANNYKSLTDKVLTTSLTEYIINNIILEKDTENLDRVKLAFFFGNIAAMEEKEKNDS